MTPKNPILQISQDNPKVLHKLGKAGDMHATVRYLFAYLYLLLNLGETIKSSSDKTGLIDVFYTYAQYAQVWEADIEI